MTRSRPRPRSLLFALAFALAAVASPAAAPPPAADLASLNIKGNDAAVEPLSGTPGGLRITFHPAEWPNARIDAPAGRPWDWRGTGLLKLDLKNPGPEAVEFGVRIDDDPRADGVRHCRTANGRLKAGEAAVLAIAISKDGPMAYGMRGLPGDGGGRSLSANGDDDLNLGHIVAAQIFVHAPKAPQTLEIRSASLAPIPSIEGIVDAFGQYTGADWPGKVHSEADLKARHQADLAELEAHPAPGDRNAFGGWKTGPRAEASGFFRTMKRDGKWWFVDPEGAPFFSLGIDCVTTGDHNTIVTGREAMFTWLPKRDEPLGRFYGHVSNVHSGPVKSGDTFSFYNANLMRIYGPDHAGRWADATLRRLASWGFNTIGNWSDRRFAGIRRTAAAGAPRTPYVATLGTHGDFATIASGSDYWGRMPDPFDPRFAEAVRRNVADAVRTFRGDPWCLGYFVDNELSWGGGGDRGRVGLALGALDLDAADSPAKRALIERLKARHGGIDRLNDAWRADVGDWATLEAPWQPSDDPAEWTGAMRDDLRGFVKEIARAYFRTVRDALKASDPDHLYMGCRFAWKTPEAIEAAAEFCDVISFNLYERKLDPAEWTILEKLDRPAIIGEFHFGALDRGMFHTGLVPTASQEERAGAYAEYVGAVLDHPSFIGCHWFQFVDEPVTGRSYDGENYNIGFLNVADLAYPEMVAAARAIHAQAYARRSGGR